MHEMVFMVWTCTLGIDAFLDCRTLNIVLSLDTVYKSCKFCTVIFIIKHHTFKPGLVTLTLTCHSNVRKMKLIIRFFGEIVNKFRFCVLVMNIDMILKQPTQISVYSRDIIEFEWDSHLHKNINVAILSNSV